MTQEDILNFTNSLQDFSLEELEAKEKEIKAEIARMILDSDTVIKASIINSLIKERKGL